MIIHDGAGVVAVAATMAMVMVITKLLIILRMLRVVQVHASTVFSALIGLNSLDLRQESIGKPLFQFCHQTTGHIRYGFPMQILLLV